MTNPGYYNSRWLKSGINAAENGIQSLINAINYNAVRATKAAVKFATQVRPKEVTDFWKTFKQDWRDPKVNVIDAINEGRYNLSANTVANHIRKLEDVARNKLDETLYDIAGKLSSGQDINKADELKQIAEQLKQKTKISFDPNYWAKNAIDEGGKTDFFQIKGDESGLGSDFEITYPLRSDLKTNVMVSPQQLLNETAIWHEPVHVAQYGLYPHVFSDGTFTYSDFSEPQLVNYNSPLFDVTQKLGSFKDPQNNYSGNLLKTPWEEVSWYRKSPEFDAEMQAYMIKNRMPKVNELSQGQKEDLVNYMYGRFGDPANSVTRNVVNELIDMFGAHGFAFGGNLFNS